MQVKQGKSSDRHDRKWGWLRSPLLLAVLGLIIVAGGTVGVFVVHADSTPSAQVTINTNSSLGTVPSTAFGINTAVWDSNLAAGAPYLQNMGVKVLRYPGGSSADVYNWENNTDTQNGNNAGGTSFSTFMQTVQTTGAQPLITVNYGSGTPALAAAWVQNANVTNHYGIKYWEIGNEIYGNGTYGADWEYDTHQKGATAYANNALQYINAMKAVDPTIKIGVVLTAPGDWPDGQIATSYGDTMDWNQTVLSILGSKIDFADVHWYTDSNGDPSNVSDAGLLSDPANIASKMQTLHSLINEYAGSNASNVQILVTESNSVASNPGKQTVSLVNALFLDEDYMGWLENGVANVDWWALYNGIVTTGDNSSSLYGSTNYGDYGVLSSGASANGQSEPAMNTPFPAYYGYEMLAKFTAPGDTMLSASSSQRLVSAYAVKHSDGSVAVLLVNADPSNSYNVSFSYNGFTPSSTVTSYFYGKGSTSITSQSLNGFSTGTLPPYSLTVYNVPAGASGSGSSSTIGVLRGVGSNRCLDVPRLATTDGTLLQIWDCNGGSNQQWTYLSNGELQVYGNKCLDVPNFAKTAGTRVQIWDCNGGSNQQWNLNADGTIVGRGSNLCLDVTGGATADGTVVQIWYCDGGGSTNQMWVRK